MAPEYLSRIPCAAGSPVLTGECPILTQWRSGIGQTRFNEKASWRSQRVRRGIVHPGDVGRYLDRPSKALLREGAERHMVTIFRGSDLTMRLPPDATIWADGRDDRESEGEMRFSLHITVQ